MVSKRTGMGVAWGAIAVGAVAWASALALVPSPAPLPSPTSPDRGPVALPAGVDSVFPVAELPRAAAACADCVGIVYAWTPRMPLSRAAIPNVIAAAEALEARVMLVSHEELQAYSVREPEPESGLVEAMLDAGMLAHAPALVVLRGDEVLGTALLGYKRADAYVSLVSARLAGSDRGYPDEPTPYARIAREAANPAALQAPADHEVIGLPGAYFRWVPNTRLIAYESDDLIYLLDLEDGVSRRAPGFVDFVPTPDGRYFVTPGEDGLEFYDAREVLAAVERGRGQSVEPIFIDLRMRDQYPSMGILQREGDRTRYRVLTSWFQGLLYRDYDVTLNPSTGASSVRPVGEAVVPCRGARLSTPIMSQSGREVAVRDESTGTTKIFEMLENGTCQEVADLGAATSKVAWSASGQKLAFATPRRGSARGEEGIFVYDRATRATIRVPASQGASVLAFPDFIGETSVVFLVPTTVRDGASFFRVVDGIE